MTPSLRTAVRRAAGSILAELIEQADSHLFWHADIEAARLAGLTAWLDTTPGAYDALGRLLVDMLGDSLARYSTKGQDDD